ncbi:serine/arginine repetitive matrix protein 1-like isoform X1 [Nasonia vitripennis]|uniref:Uncharacterized protein n=1 Tax=Nasonia vitripennis TaxID=7425 RepID=A0A7M7HJS3_NASVI|nr:serine/arginine repetitive matrix protein 1-like isoform X1 [Nasonia vitripennis]
MVKCVSLPIAFSTPKRTVEKCSLSLNFQSHKPYERWTPQAEFTKSQVNIHQNSLSLERDDNVSVSIPQFSPILNGSHLSQSQTPRRLRDKSPFRLQTLLTSTVNGPGDHHSPSVGVSKMRCNRLSTLQKIPRLDSPLPSDKRASQYSLSNASLNLDYIDQSDHSDLRMPSRSRRGRLPSIASDSSSRYKDISGPKSQSSTPFVPSNRLYSPVMSSPQEPSTPTRSCSEARSVRRSLSNSLSRSVAEFRTEQETPPRRTGPRSGAQEVVPTRTPPRRPGPRSVTQKVVPTRTPPRRPGPRSLTQVVVPTRTPPRRPGPRSQTQEVVPTRTPPRRPGSASPGREDIQDNEDENENLEVSAGGESDSAVPMLEQYKPKLFKKYNKAGYDLDSNIPEQHKRYDIVRNKIYLGEGRTIGQKSWRIIKSKRKNAFLRDLGTILWTKKVIALRSLDLSKLKKKYLWNKAHSALFTQKTKFIFKFVQRFP